MSDAHPPDPLVSTDWVHAHLEDPHVRIVEVDEDPQAYRAGHVPGAAGWDWGRDLQDPVRRDVLDPEAFEALLGGCGIGPQHALVLYGDRSNWFAAYGFWLCRLYGHPDVRLMDGGRDKWLAEEDRPLTRAAPDARPVAYRITDSAPEHRAALPEALDAARGGGWNLIDVRSPEEYRGDTIAPPGMRETAQRGGRIPGSVNIPWSEAVASDGTFLAEPSLRRRYIEEGPLDPRLPTLVYCRIGERSSHTWFVLTERLGLTDVRNYDGGWTEYGNVIGCPIERGPGA
jgi:thiosulfate/3-mercaptopyruvate sulfurtransferase